jgi:hypothetical protein
MPPDLGRPFLVDFSGVPPHMSALDFVLWNRFRVRNPLPFLRLYFDVAVGQGADTGTLVDPALQAAWKRVTQQRVDVVGEFLASWTIIEIRAAAGPGAIGSLLVYRDLWLSDSPDARPLSLWLVTDSISSNLSRTLALNSIRLFLV